MAVKMRLQRKGRRKKPFYHIVVADARAPRDGRFIERLGTYNPMTKPATIDLDRDKAYEWLLKGAQPTETVRAILRFKGVLYRKHLMRGVKKGALTQEDADRLYQEWIDSKEAKVALRVEEAKEEHKKFLERVSGKPPRRVAPAAEAQDIPETAPVETKEHMTLAEEAEAKAKAEEAAAAATDEAKEEAKPEEKKEEPKEEPKAEAEEETKAETEEAPAEEAAEEKAEEEKTDEEESKDDEK